MGQYRMATTNTLSKKYPKQVNSLSIFALVLISIGVLILPTRSFGNDSIAALGAGGIELIKSEHIRMLEEILEISPQKVRVKYRFFNESDQDINTKDAFPLPFYGGIAHANVPIGDPNRIFTTFKVSVNNRPVVTGSERKALLDGRDITNKLRKLGLSDEEMFFNVDDQGKGALWKKLKQFIPKVGDWWDISQIIFWDMTFPAGKETVVDHEYKPATGFGFAHVGNGENLNEDISRLWRFFTGKDEERENEDRLDKTTRRAIENQVKMAASKGA